MAQAFRTQNLRLLASILDANDNELIKSPSPVASAVNELTISNAAATSSPSISATGNDTNIGLNLISKGTGLIQINGKAISLANSFTTIGNFSLAFETTASTSLTLPTSGILATTSQIPTVYDNILTLAGSGGIGVGTSPTFTANASVDKTITITIADAALTLAKLANISGSTILGNSSPSSAGAPAALSVATVASMLSNQTMNIVGTATSVTNIVLVAKGGTGVATANANTIFVGPSTGAAAGPSFRAMVTADIPTGIVTYAKIQYVANTARVLGRISSLSGEIEELNGANIVTIIDTNAVSRATNLAGGIAGQIPYQSGANTTLFSAAGSASQVLLSGAAGAPTWANQSSLSVGSATTADSLANALTISSPLTGISYNGSSAVSIGLQDASATLAGGVSIGPQTFAGNKTFKDSVIVSGDLTVNGTTITINSSTLSVDDKNIELGAVIAIASLSSTSNITATSNIVNVTSTSGLIVGQALTKTGGTGAFGASPVIDSIVSATQFTVLPVHATTGSIIFSVGGATDVTADGGGITLKGTTDKTIIWVDSTDAWTLSEHLNIASGKVYRINGNDVLSSTTLGSGVVNSSLTSVGTLTGLTVTNTITGSVSGSAASLSTSHTFWGQTFNGTQDVSGNLTSVGNITGSSAITITAGGSHQNVVLTPTGTGYTLLNGNVGIGTTSPAHRLQLGSITSTSTATPETLSLAGSYSSTAGSNPKLRVWTDGTYSMGLGVSGDQLDYILGRSIYDHVFYAEGSRLMTIKGGGNVGIGTATPSGKLHVNSTTSGATLLRTDGTNGTLFSVVDDLSDSLMSVNNSAGLPVLEVFADDRIVAGQYGQNDFVVINNKVGLGANSPINKLSVIGAASIGDSTYNVSAPANGLIVQGNVGIGTNNPSQLLEIKKTTGSAIALLNYNDVVKFNINASSGGAGYVGMVTNHPLIFVINDTEKWKITSTGILQSNGAQTIQTSVDNLTLATLSGNGHIVLSPHGNGNVGIGTATPGVKLDVVGSAAISSTLTVTGITALNGAVNLSTAGTPIVTLGASTTYGVLTAAGTNAASIYLNGATRTGFEAKLQFGAAEHQWFNGSLSSQIMTLNTNGLGIGITSPAATLDVNGATFLRGNLNAGRTANLNTTAAVNGTGGGNRGFDTSFTGASTTGFTGSDSIDQGYGYFAATIVLGKSYEVSATISVTNGTSSALIISPGLDYTAAGTQVIQNDPGPISNTIYRFTAGVNAAYVGLGFSRGTGTMTVVVSNFSIKEVSILVTSNSNVGIVTTSPTNTLDVNGSARVRSISASGSQATKFLTTDANGVLISRTNAEVRSDILAAATDQTFFIGTTSIAINRASGASFALTGISSIDGTAAALASMAITQFTGTLAVANGGTGVATAAINTIFAGPSSGSTAAPSFRAMVSADIPSGAVTYAKIQNTAALSVIGVAGVSVATVAAITGSAGQVLRVSNDGTALAFGAINLGSAFAVTGLLPIANGGTGIGTTAANAFFVGPDGNTGAPSFRAMVSADIPTGIVSYSKIQNVNPNKVLGRITNSVGIVEELSGADIATIIGSSAITNASNVAITTDDATNSSHFLYFGATGTANNALKASTKIRYNPSTGAFSATTKSFRIPHPTKLEHDLVYGSLESPYHGVRLTGKGKTKGNRAEIFLPDYIKSLIDEETVNIQLTAIKCAKILYIENIIIDDNKFTVKYDKPWYEKCKDIEFYWDFTAERKDVPKLIVEEKI